MQESNKVKPDDFRAGDVVWCVLHGKGEVTHIESSGQDTYPVEICFDEGASTWCTQDGRYSEEFKRTIFFSEPRVEASVTRPFAPTLVGKTVIMEYFDGTRTDPAMVTAESKDAVFYGSGSNYKSDLTAIYEVSSENLLNP